MKSDEKTKNRLAMVLDCRKTILQVVFTIFLTTCFALTISGCSKDEKVTQPVETSTSNNSTKEGNVAAINKTIDRYSKVIAVAQKNVEFRKAIKQVALEMFDGDYDILVSELHTRSLPNSGESVFNLLASIVDNSFSEEFKTNGQSFLEEVVSMIPNLQVAVPIHIEEWDPVAYRPYVIPLPIDFEDGKNNMVNGYDGNLSIIKVSSTEKPNYPLIVVGVSERVDSNGKLYKNPNEFPQKIEEKELPAPSNLYCEYTPAANAVRLRWPLVPGAIGYAVYQTDDLGNDVLVGTTSGSGNIFNSTGLETARTYQYMVRSIDSVGEYSAYTNIAEITATDRRSGDPLRLKSFQFSKAGLYAVESYLKGAPEIQLRIIKSNGTGDSSVVLYSARLDPSRRSDVTSSPYICDEVLFSSWTQSRYNDVLIFEWREVDNTFPIVVNVSASYTIDTLRTLLGVVSVNANTNFNVSTNSDIARHNVCFWDPKDFSYGSLVSGFTFMLDASLNN